MLTDGVDLRGAQMRPWYGGNRERKLSSIAIKKARLISADLTL